MFQVTTTTTTRRPETTTGYDYPKPAIPFEEVTIKSKVITRPPTPPPAPVTYLPPVEDGYHYDKPAIPFNF